MAQPVGSQILTHGQHIFIYSNIRTNQVVYSFTRSLNNHDAIKQLPFLGKKTVPASLRKDLWLPLAHVQFPKPIQGIIAYRKLREFRRLHETTYPRELITYTEGPHKGLLMNTKHRGKVLMNQKANSIADLAAVLLQQERAPTAKQIEAANSRQKRAKIANYKRKVKLKPVPVEDMTGVEGVKIHWANILDAEYAETWPTAVVHEGMLQRSRYTIAFPQKGPEDTSEESKTKVKPGDESLQNTDAAKQAAAGALASRKSKSPQPETASQSTA